MACPAYCCQHLLRLHHLAHLHRRRSCKWLRSSPRLNQTMMHRSGVTAPSPISMAVLVGVVAGWSALCCALSCIDVDHDQPRCVGVSCGTHRCVCVMIMVND